MKRTTLVVILILSSVIVSACGQKEIPASSQIEDKCIIEVEGQKYDVTAFRKIHKGGDVFDCGSNMTAKFKNKHGMEILLKVANLKI